MSRTPLILTLGITAAVAGLALTGCSTGALPGSGSANGTPGTSSSASASASSTAPATTAGALPAHCPSAAEAGAAIGASLPTPNENRTSTLLSCTYSASSDVVLVVLYEPIPAGTTIDQIKQDTLTKTGGTLGTLTGIGNGGFTLSDGDNNYVYVVSHDIQFAIGGGYSLDALKGAASKLLAG